MTRSSSLGPSRSTGLNLVGEHLADGDARPAGDHLGDGLRVDGDLHERRLALDGAERVHLGRELGLQGAQLRGGLEGWASPLPSSSAAAWFFFSSR